MSLQPTQFREVTFKIQTTGKNGCIRNGFLAQGPKTEIGFQFHRVGRSRFPKSGHESHVEQAMEQDFG